MNYRRYLQSDHWRELSAAKLESVGDHCERCPRKTQLEVHHLHYETLGRERLTDLQVLCRRCHQKHHDDAIAAKLNGAKPLERPMCPREAAREAKMAKATALAKLQEDFDALVKLGQHGQAERVHQEMKWVRIHGDNKRPPQPKVKPWWEYREEKRKRRAIAAAAAGNVVQYS